MKLYNFAFINQNPFKIMITFIVIVVLALLIVLMTVKVVPQQTAYVVERLGKFYGVLQPGINFIIPFFDRIAYKHSLKEKAIDIPEHGGPSKGLIRYQ